MQRTGKFWKVLRWLVLILACLFVVAQFIRPAKTNPASEPSLAIESHLQVDPKVAQIFDRSCADCHSNKTRWPWYTQIAPVSWFVIDHVNEGRDEMNFSQWGSYERSEQKHLLEGICELVREDAMPLSSYTPLHPGSKLTEADVKTICDWTSREGLRLR